MTLSEADRQSERRGMLQFYGASVGLVGIFVVGLLAMAFLTRAGG